LLWQREFDEDRFCGLELGDGRAGRQVLPQIDLAHAELAPEGRAHHLATDLRRERLDVRAQALERRFVRVDL
jgi:hypothetical protein